jgi:hypothetical protein
LKKKTKSPNETAEVYSGQEKTKTGKRVELV